MSDKKDNPAASAGSAEGPAPLFENRFLNVYDLRNAPGGHYFAASRRKAGDLAAVMDDASFREMTPDAVTCAVIVSDPENEGEDGAKLLLSYEYRYPCGRFLLSPPAGLLDPGDSDGNGRTGAILAAAEREIFEETGLTLRRERGDRLDVVNPLLFSSPGMTDESNAIACAVLRISPDELKVRYDNVTGTERFSGSLLLSRDEAAKILKDGRGESGNFYSVYTALVLMYFISGMWR